LRCVCFGQENKTIAGFPGAERYDEERSLLEEDCDILCPCAVPSVITEENAPRIQARIIAEGANGPITYDAHQILLSRNVRSLTAVIILLFFSRYHSLATLMSIVCSEQTSHLTVFTGLRE